MSATYMIVTNASANSLSFEGDDRKPSGSIARAGTENIYMNDVLGNDLLCTTLAAWVTDGTVTITRGGVAVTAAQLTAYIQGADMDRTDYDDDDDLVVDKAEAIDTTSRTAVAFAASPYTVLAGDTLIQTDSSGGAIGLTLPIGVDGKTYIVKDGSGDAGTNAITLTPNGAETIEGAATYAVDTAYAAIQLYYDLASTDWKLLDIAGIDPTDVNTNTTRTGNWLAGNVPAQTDVNLGASPYTVLAADVVLNGQTTTGAIALTLPIGVNGKTYLIKDVDGNGATNAITITPNGAETIEGGATYVVDTDYAAVTLVYDATDTDWKILSIAGIDPTAVVTNTTRTGNWLAGNVPNETDVNNGATPYTVLAADVLLSVLSTTGVVELLLPVGVEGKTYAVKDSDGDAGTNTITITPNGAETIEGAATLTLLHNFDEITLVYDLTDTDWKVIHRVENNLVRGLNAAVDMVAVAPNVVTLNGGASRAVLLKEAQFICTAGAALNGDVTLTIGNTVGGVQIMAALPLTGLDTAGETFRILLEGVFPAIPGNDILDVSVTIADTGGGATGTMTVILIGEEV